MSMETNQLEASGIEQIDNIDQIVLETVGQPSFIKKWGTLVVLSLALAIIVIDTTLLNVSLGSIIRDLNTDIQSLQWVITAYSLTLAALTITGGRMGDLFGRKNMFMIGAILFAIGSLIASFSNDFQTLLVGESIIEGIGAALMMPATSSLLLVNFKGRDRALAFGVWGGIAAAASAIGPIVGGYLTSNFSWRWGFRINVVVTILLLLGSVLITDKTEKKAQAKIDFLGVLLSSTGLLAIVFAFIEASTYGWWKATKIFMIGNIPLDFAGISVVPVAIWVGLIILALFVIWEIKLEQSGKLPLVSMRLFTNKQFTSGIVTSGIMSLGQAGLIFSIPVFLQSVRGLDAFQTGLSLLPMSITLLIAAPLSAFISKFITPKRLIQIGLLIDAAAMLILRSSFSLDATAWSFAPGLMCYGFGMGLIMAQLSNLSLSAVPVKDAGEASGVNNTVRQIGSSLGSAIIGAVMLSSLSTNLVQGMEKYQGVPTSLKPYLEQTLADQTSNIEFNGGAKFQIALPAEINADIKAISELAITEANQSALICAAIFVLMGLLASTMLPNVKNLEAKTDQPKSAH